MWAWTPSKVGLSKVVAIYEVGSSIYEGLSQSLILAAALFGSHPLASC